MILESFLPGKFGRVLDSWEFILGFLLARNHYLEDLTSVVILGAFFDRILEEIGRDRNSFWKRFEAFGLHLAQILKYHFLILFGRFPIRI